MIDHYLLCYLFNFLSRLLFSLNYLGLGLLCRRKSLRGCSWHEVLQCWTVLASNARLTGFLSSSYLVVKVVDVLSLLNCETATNVHFSDDFIAKACVFHNLGSGITEVCLFVGVYGFNSLDGGQFLGVWDFPKGLLDFCEVLLLVRPNLFASTGSDKFD